MAQASPHLLLAAMAEGKNVLEGLVSVTKSSSLKVLHITSAPNDPMQWQEVQKYNPTLCSENGEPEIFGK